MSDLILRNAEERDLPALKSLTLKVRGLAETETPSFQADFHKVFSLCIDDPKCHIIVAEKGAQIWGSISFAPASPMPGSVPSSMNWSSPREPGAKVWGGHSCRKR